MWFYYIIGLWSFTEAFSCAPRQFCVCEREVQSFLEHYINNRGGNLMGGRDNLTIDTWEFREVLGGYLGAYKI